MLRLGFDTKWVTLIMLFVSTVQYSIQLPNGNIGPISPTRGLRQGDPISPYLFLICAEGLTSLLHYYARQGELHGIKIASTAPPITHLFFADDSFLFFKATSQESECIKNCIKQYGEASGQLVNFEKSSILFSPNVADERRDSICNHLGVSVCQNHGNYLGVPSLIGRKKTDIFEYIKERVWKKLSSWHHKLLSRAGKEILIKSVVQAVPSYVMSVFLIPVGICDDLERMMNRFWWGRGAGSGSGVHWKCWDRLCAKKLDGGLGFRKLKIFNQAMLAKQSWKLLTKPDSLLGQIYKARYYPNSSFLSATLGSNPSYIWRSLMTTQYLLSDGLRLRVGTGQEINIWRDPWLLDMTNPYVETSAVDNYPTVDTLISNDAQWKIDVIDSIFSMRDRDEILSIPISHNDVNDTWYWRWDKKGVYTVKSGYHRLMVLNSSVPIPICTNWKWIWAMAIPPKVRNFLWRTLSHCLPTMAALHSRISDISVICPICQQAEEDALHALVNCSSSRRIWQASKFGDLAWDDISFVSWWNRRGRITNKEDMELVAMILWKIWENRNSQVWNAKCETPVRLVYQAEALLLQWKVANVIEHQHDSIGSNSAAVKWSTPPPNFLKCNVDASLFSSSCGYGGVLRDSNGQFVAAVQGQILGRHNPQMAEVLGLREVLSWVKNSSYSNVLIESDAQLVVSAVNSSISDLSSFGLIVDDCKTLIKSLDHCVLSWVKRSANIVAHSLARAAYSTSGQESWVMSAPPFISDVILHDLIN